MLKKILQKIFLILLLGIITCNAWGYGGGGGGYSTKCKKPSFKNFSPEKLIAPGGEFSFTASSNTDAKSIKVVIKGHKIDLKVKDDYGYQVSGNLPPELTDGFARVKIKANSTPKSCIAEGGWLLKIGE